MSVPLNTHNKSIKYTSQSDLLYKILTDFYNKDENQARLIKSITEETKISLRLIDWFTTNYAKKNYTTYDVANNDGSETKRFKVHVNYKLQLKSYSKRRFDPCCRRERIFIPYKNNTSIETTIGQLNFFKWVIENNIIEYIEENYLDIKNDMDNNAKNKTKTNKTTNDNSIKTRKKRSELSVSATKCIKKETVEIVVKFD